MNFFNNLSQNDIDESLNLPVFGSKTHNFTMYNFYGGVHKSFTIKY